MRISHGPSRFLAIMMLLVATASGVLFPVSPTFAQDSRTLFQRLFAPSEKQQEQVEQRREPSNRPAVRTKRNRRDARPSPVLTEAPEQNAEKLEAARVVLVVGDFLSGGLAEGLTAAFAGSPGVRIVQRSNGSSGLVRDDFYDWIAELPAILEEEQASVVVLMIGANDRQEIRTTSPRLSLRSEGWNREYEERAKKLASIVTDKNIPLIWVGVPAFKSPRMSSDMVAFNDIYKRAATATNQIFVDIWDGFVNETGAYVTTGPDMNGHAARLRASDGINITAAGRRKIAFYVEKPLRKLLGNAASPDIGQLGPENLPELMLNPSGPVIDRTPPVALDDPELDGGNELLGANVTPIAGESSSLGSRMILDGIAPPASTGRADDFTAKPLPKPPVKSDRAEPPKL